MMNAAMLHQRIAYGDWLKGVSDLERVKNDTNVVRRVWREWSTIRSYDFRPVVEPAIEVIEAVEDQGKLSGLERALRHIAAEAERIAQTYADMGADHAGPLFNKVMGNQASDGAYFTRPTAASLAARLTLDACGDVDWSDPQVWRAHKTVDLACGSGTLLAAMLTEMKRRAAGQGASEDQLVDLQKLAVEQTLNGLDINPVSLQLAASQLTAGNREIRYRRMGLHLMPYGPSPDNPARVQAGTIELLGQRAIVPRDSELDLADDGISSQLVWDQPDDSELEDAVDAVKDARIVIMNPPFTSRKKMGEKFPQATKKSLQQRVDTMERFLTSSDRDFIDFTDKNAIGPLFVALADKAVPEDAGIITMVIPTIALTSDSGRRERIVLADRYHVHTIMTCHQPGQINLSQNTSINESIVLLRRQRSSLPTRIINFDRFPINDAEVADFHTSLVQTDVGNIKNGWGEVSYCPAERMKAGEWTASIWRSPALADAAHALSSDRKLTLVSENFAIRTTLEELYGSFTRSTKGTPGVIPVLASKSSEGQTLIQSTPDEYWIPKGVADTEVLTEDGTYPLADKLMRKASYLLVTHGQDSSTARVTATAGSREYVGTGWMPVLGVTAAEAKALCVYLNSTPGRLSIMQSPGTKLTFPFYNPADIGGVPIPDVRDDRIRHILSDCWELTKDEVVPQFRDGECEVRQLWDDAVAEAMGWDPKSSRASACCSTASRTSAVSATTSMPTRSSRPRGRVGATGRRRLTASYTRSSGRSGDSGLGPSV